MKTTFRIFFIVFTLLALVAVNGTAFASLSIYDPQVAEPGSLFPIAVDKNLVDSYFSQNPLPSQPSTIILTLQSNGTAGWTPFQTPNFSTPNLSLLMFTGNPASLETGDSIYITFGTSTPLANSLQDYLNSGADPNVMLPVIQIAPFAQSGSALPILGFVGFHIDGQQTSSVYNVYGHFTNETLSAVPLPAGHILLGSGLLCLGILRRRLVVEN